MRDAFLAQLAMSIGFVACAPLRTADILPSEIRVLLNVTANSVLDAFWLAGESLEDPALPQGGQEADQHYIHGPYSLAVIISVAQSGVDAVLFVTSVIACYAALVLLKCLCRSTLHLVLAACGRCVTGRGTPSARRKSHADAAGEEAPTAAVDAAAPPGSGSFAFARSSTVTDKEEEECFLCCDSSRADGVTLVRGVCNCNGTAMHLDCQQRMIRAAQEQGKENVLFCSVCDVRFNNVALTPERRQLTRAGMLWLGVSLSALGVIACALTILTQWGPNSVSLSWHDYLLQCLSDVQSDSLQGQHTWLLIAAVLHVVLGVVILSWALFWIALYVDGHLERPRNFLDRHGGAGLCLQPPWLLVRTVRVWDPADSQRSRERREGPAATATQPGEIPAALCG